MENKNQRTETEKKTIIPISEENLIKKILISIFQVSKNLKEKNDMENYKKLQKIEKIILDHTKIKFTSKDREQLLIALEILN